MEPEKTTEQHVINQFKSGTKLWPDGKLDQTGGQSEIPSQIFLNNTLF